MDRVHTLTVQLGIRHPIIQAPMAGISTPALAAAVSEAGGLGSLGIGASTLDDARQQIRDTRRLTGRPFNVNLFCHAHAAVDDARESAWLAHLRPLFRQFDARPPDTLTEIYPSALDNAPLLSMLLEERPAVVSFHFGLPSPGWVEQLHDAGIVTMGCATNLDEAAQIARAGVQVLVAQGIEAGGHRGVFDPAHDDEIPTHALVSMLARETRLPIVAAGGIMDSAGMSAALALGASAVQLGTAFLLCPEAATGAAYRSMLTSERARHTGVTSAISGRPARGIVNEIHRHGAVPGAPSPPAYPRAYDAGKALHAAASRRGNHEYGAFWAGQGAPLAIAEPAAAVIQRLVDGWAAG